MYPVGIMFGLGFDTSSEIALLGISAISASQGTSIWLILLFPNLFTSGMCLLDTLDGALMMSMYTSARLASDSIAVLYYQTILTGITVLVAVIIGVIQFLSMLQGAADLEGGFWDGVEVVSDHYDIIGEHLFKQHVCRNQSDKMQVELYAACSRSLGSWVWRFTDHGGGGLTQEGLPLGLHLMRRIL